MCGIVGWLDFSRDLSDHGDVIEAMTETMRLRGPDDHGVWLDRHVALGHRRLAIIDLVGGHQPMVATDGATVLVYSGEVYNYKELRTELQGRGHVFTERSDTEVVLHAYREWGAACAERLIGMFAFAVWDARKQELVLVRDRLGIKPLYYAPTPHGVLFASEPKGIFANPEFRPAVDESMLPVLLNRRLALPGQTPVRGLHEVKPGHVLTVTRAGLRQSAYWRLTTDPHPDDLPTTVTNVRALLHEVVHQQLVADVPIATLLSGGLDSTATTAIAARAVEAAGAGPLSTFSVDFPEDAATFRPTVLRPERDAPYASLAAERIGTRHSTIALSAPAVAAARSRAMQAMDAPISGQFDASMYLLFAGVRERSDARVLLSGEAADEVFGGYPWFHDAAALNADTFPWLGNAPRLWDCLSADVIKRIRPGDVERDHYAQLRAAVPRLPGEDPAQARRREALYLSLQGPLAVLLERKDRLSMASGLEVRVPFCDHRLLQYVWNTPWSMKNADGREKSLLRMAVGDLVPAEILRRRKSAYPAMHDPAHDATVLNAVNKLVVDETSPLYGLVDADRVHTLIGSGNRTMTHVNAAHLVLPLLEIDAWMRAYDIEVIRG
ncbi:asparagine synthase (glutamine-hydrolyzing) [Actinoplanes siamensis]|uniref:asparagine synthase (glutamine-hydrolyzing) n=1 Tax=Actinoplanes siamensis TaxID=1223317 RepID=A0A919N0X0_9ACTN|nr:asparagine synthase (glutamine-hydrolyzing) [Actinoplanes siamensis]GIF03135.1 asparagine synthetase B [Actinoplanes siamensis]